MDPGCHPGVCCNPSIQAPLVNWLQDGIAALGPDCHPGVWCAGVPKKGGRHPNPLGSIGYLGATPARSSLVTSSDGIGRPNPPPLVLAGASDSNNEAEDERSALWRLIWKLKVPPKLIHFTWRMCVNILAVKKSLYSKHCCPSPRCSFCAEEEEDIDHAIFYCEWARKWWEESGFGELINEAVGETWPDRVGWVLKHLEEDERGRFLTIAWAIWTVRNQSLFEESPPLPDFVFTGFTKMVADYRAYANSELYKSRLVSDVGGNSWTPPRAGTFKINTDAHLMGNGEVGLGAVARDMAGTIIWVGSKRVLAEWEVEVAEARAAIFGLEVALARGMANITLESDALNLVKAVKNPEIARTPFGLCVEDLRISLNLFSSSNVSHVKRGGNTVAHFIARMCETEGDEIVLGSDFPQAIMALADLDLI
ncbi:uncharacterized protein LOC141636938 [Silene latifolia]|uniref:uncharacterized protein LOC141636938 n=1 Tax=Silene latifolia TaxID=37657 RepID=UPI003D773781